MIINLMNDEDTVKEIEAQIGCKCLFASLREDPDGKAYILILDSCGRVYICAAQND